MDDGSKRTTPLSTTETSLKIIDAIWTLDGARLSRLTDELDLAKSTVHSHLTTLQNARYVTKEGETYHLGLKFFELGEYVISRKESYDVAEEMIVDLSDRVEYVTDFSVEEHGRVVSLYSDLYNTDPSFLGNRRTFYMHNTAAGKALLASFDESKVRRILEQWGLERETEVSISTPEELFDELEQIQDQGYAINDEESLEGLYSIAMVVSYSNGDACGAISVDIPRYRVDDTIVENTVAELEKTVDEFETVLETENIV